MTTQVSIPADQDRAYHLASFADDDSAMAFLFVVRDHSRRSILIAVHMFIEPDGEPIVLWPISGGLIAQEVTLPRVGGIKSIIRRGGWRRVCLLFLLRLFFLVWVSCIQISHLLGSNRHSVGRHLRRYPVVKGEVEGGKEVWVEGYVNSPGSCRLGGGWAVGIRVYVD